KRNEWRLTICRVQCVYFVL
ncbi:hypothetical protein D030_3790B, partial [Vibrio parahaemolyticus AQ3810]